MNFPLKNIRNYWAMNYLPTLLILIGAVSILYTTFDLSNMYTILFDINLIYFSIATLLFFATFPLRGLRWERLLTGVSDTTPTWEIIRALFFGFFLNIILPVKLGDFYRSIVVESLDIAERFESFGTVISERLLDIVFVIISLSVIVLTIPFVQSGSVRQIIYISTTGSVILLFILYLLKKYNPSFFKGIFDKIGTGLFSIRKLGRREKVDVCLYTLGIWFLVILRVYVVVLALGTPVSLLNITIVAIIISVLAGLPYIPGGAGIVELVGPAFLVASGVSPSIAVSIVLVDRIITIGLLLVVGGVLYVFNTTEEESISTTEIMNKQ